MFRRRLVGACSLAALLLGGGSALAQSVQPSLAEVARQEAERRQAVGKPAKVYTNDDTKSGRPLTTGSAALAAAQKPADTQKGGEAAVGSAGVKAGPGGTAGGAATPKAGDAREALLKRILDLKEQISRNDLAKANIAGQLDKMNNDIIDAFDSQVRQKLVEERDASLATYRKLDTDNEGLRKVLADLEADARKTEPGSK